jgi:hypothetical protein
VGQTAVEILVQHLSRPLPPLGPRCPEAPHGLVALVEDMLVKRYEDRPTAAFVRDRIEQMRESEASYAAFQLELDGIPSPVLEEAATAQLRVARTE